MTNFFANGVVAVRDVPPWNAGTHGTKRNGETYGTGGTPETRGTRIFTSQNTKTV